MPEISIIIPCYNEEKRIATLLTSLCHQTFSVDEFEVIIADGMSNDNTRSIINNFNRSNEKKLNLTIVDNPKKAIPSALNVAIKVAQGKIIIRLDAHSIPQDTYVEKCVTLLRQGVAENVGGVWNIVPGDETLIAQSISLAAAHPLGVGGAEYRSQNAKPGFVDTVPFGAFFKTLLDQLGGYDETLLSNEDYELNTRILKSGGKIWLDPSIRCTYFSRSTLRTLAKQYWRYGFWKFQMLKRYPATIRFRQALPPLFILSILTLLSGSLLHPLFFYMFLFEMVTYIFTLFVGTAKTAFTQQKPIHLWMAMVLSVMTMHFSWGIAFLWAILQDVFRNGNEKNIN